ncbi:MAG TPA: hypothetical protein VH134_08080 [Candidatus Dormibacteraeota bacterium]|nr:hypothetical protein [Candidatus Dormibacteraeota bacterium]
MQRPHARASALRRAWREGVAALGPEAVGLPGLGELLDGRLAELEQAGTLDEPSLLPIAEEAAQLALETGSTDLARSLSRRLRRSIYEFLLALDAAPATSVPSAPVAPLEPTRPSRWGQVLIGVEEVEAAQRSGPGAPVLDLGPAGVVGADDAVTAEVARSVARSEAVDGAWGEAEAGRLLDIADAAGEEVAGLRSLLEEAMAQGLDVPLPALGSTPSPALAAAVEEARIAADQEALRSAAADEARIAAELEARRLAAEDAARRRVEAEAHAERLLAELEVAEAAAAHAVLLRLRVMEMLPEPALANPEALRVPPIFRRDLPIASLPDPEPVAPPQPAFPSAPPAAHPPAAAAPGAPRLFPIAPREGFHLTDPSMVDATIASAGSPSSPAAPPAPAHWSLPPSPPSPPSLPGMPTAAASAPAPAPAFPFEQPPPGGGSGGWSVRQSPRQQMLTERMAQKRREEAVRAAQEAAGIAAALAEPERRGRRRGREKGPERIADVAAARDHVEEHLKRKRGAEAAALLQRVAAELPGRETADLALDSGDRCLALGQNRSATNCYLAGWRADPLYEASLWRLADVCLADREVALATGYLERVAELMRTRGDDAGALAVYRKIVTVAPDREDIRRLVRLAQATGRLEV